MDKKFNIRIIPSKKIGKGTEYRDIEDIQYDGRIKFTSHAGNRKKTCRWCIL